MNSEGFTPLEGVDLGATIRGFVSGQKVLKRYTLRKILGRGGMGVVWLAFDEELEREIAFKFLPEIVAHDRGALDSLKRETRRSLELTHPNIVRIYDFVQDEHCAGITMEYINGDTLSNMRVEQPNKVFEASDLQPWVMQVCSALEYAHEVAKVAHRDLKPSNLMINQRGLLKITDFGISRSISDTMTRATAAFQGASGTLVYMSPQQALGEPAAASDDIYSLGATVYELMTSKPPFFTGEILVQVREKKPASVAERRAQLDIKGAPIPATWEEVIAACLEKDPAKRPRTPRDVLRRLGISENNTNPYSVTERPPTTAQPAGEVSAEVVKSPTSEEDQKIDVKTKVVSPSVALPRDDLPEFRTPQPVGASADHSQKALWLILATLVAGFITVILFGIFRHNGNGGRTGGIVRFSTTPAGATVKINGESIGQTPFVNYNLKAGPAVFEFSLPGYVPFIVKTNVDRENPLRLDVPLEEVLNPGAISFAMAPEDSEAMIDGKPVNGPRASILPGKHILSVSHNGYETKSLTFTLKSNQETNLGAIFLDRSKGALLVRLSPADARFEIQTDKGTKQAKGSDVMTDVPSGNYQVRIFREGYETKTIPVTVTPHQTVEIGLIPLNRTKGALLLNTVPGDATVELKTADFGPRTFKTGEPIADLPTGKYEVSVRSAGYVKTNLVVDVAANRTTTISKLALVRGFGTMTLSANQSGAAFSLSGPKEEKGFLPARLEHMPVGTYTVEIHKDRFDPVSVEAELENGLDMPVKANLVRSKGALALPALPGGAMYEVRGQETNSTGNQTPAVVTNLPTGQYTVLATYKNWAISNTVAVASKTTNAVTLKFPFGIVHLDTAPGRAAVYSGDTKLGETPLDLNEVPVGPVEYRVELNGYRFTSVKGVVRAQEKTVLKPKLEHYPGPQRGMKEWVNSLGMRFVPVGDVWFCIWETRVKDFDKFYERSHYNAGAAWRDPGFKQSSTHPVVNVSWNDATAFCKWLTEEESKKGKIADQVYRLPTDLEWSRAVNLLNETGSTPAQRDGGRPEQFLWGTDWPPPLGCGNFASVISFDEYEFTAPVGSFQPNAYGIYDLAGNAWEWCEDTYDNSSPYRVLRGESWNLWPNSNFSASNRRFLDPTTRLSDVGFRCVIQMGPAKK